MVTHERLCDNRLCQHEGLIITPGCRQAVVLGAFVTLVLGRIRLIKQKFVQLRDAGKAEPDASTGVFERGPPLYAIPTARLPKS